MESKVKQVALRRLYIARGQLNGLIAMVEKEKYCVDIITQSSAIREALAGAEELMLRNHLSTHVIAQMKSGKEKKAVQEILEVYKLARKRP